MYTNFKYKTIVSPPQILGYYNFPAFNTFRRVIFQTLYNSKILSLDLFQKILSHFLFPRVDIFEMKKNIFFCPCKLDNSGYFSDLHLNTEFPQMLSNPIERDFTITIFSPNCSLKFFRDCFSRETPLSNCNNVHSNTFDLFWINNNDLTFGNETNLSTANNEYTFIFIYPSHSSKNLAYILCFPSSTHKVKKAEFSSTDFYINDEYFTGVHYLSIQTSEHYGGLWLHQGNELIYPSRSFSQDEFNSVKRF